MWTHRLIVLGTRRQVQRFQNGNWEQLLRARYIEPLEFSPCRFVCQFSTQHFPLKSLRQLSRRQTVVLLLEFEHPRKRIIGVAKATAGQLEHCEINY